MKKYIFGFILILAIFLLQYSFINFSGELFTFVNPLLFSIIFVSLFYSAKITIFWVIIGGFLLDIYSLFNFGIHIISLMVMVLLVHYFFQKFITNHTFYSFVFLTAASTLFYYLLLMALTTLLYILNFSELTWQMNNQLTLAILVQILINSVFMGLIYYIFSSFSNRLKANFILKSNNK
ncbi:MAG: hypothetical protein ABIH38_01320 [Patescibacteria group bacterium]